MLPDNPVYIESTFDSQFKVGAKNRIVSYM